MKSITICGLVLCYALAPSLGQADQAAEDRAFAAALEARLKVLELDSQNCRRGATDPSALDACEKRIDAERHHIEAILANPARLRQESDRLRTEFRRELLRLLAELRPAATMLSAQSSYDQFILKIAGLGNHMQLIRSQYSIPLSRGDHRALGMPLSEACNDLYAGAADWKQLRLATKEVDEAQRARARAAAWEADYFQQHLQAAQIRYADAQKRLAEHTASALALIQTATRVAQGDAMAEQAVSIKR